MNSTRRSVPHPPVSPGHNQREKRNQTHHTPTPRSHAPWMGSPSVVYTMASPEQSNSSCTRSYPSQSFGMCRATLNQWFVQLGPNASPFFAGLYFCRFASSKVGLVRPGADHTSSLTCSVSSSRCEKRSGERLTEEKCPPWRGQWPSTSGANAGRNGPIDVVTSRGGSGWRDDSQRTAQGVPGSSRGAADLRYSA